MMWCEQTFFEYVRDTLAAAQAAPTLANIDTLYAALLTYCMPVGNA